MTFSGQGDQPGAAKTVALKTPDSFDKVAKFYKDKYGKDAMTFEGDDGLTIQLQQKGKMVTIVVSRDEDDEETTIGINVIEGMGG